MGGTSGAVYSLFFGAIAAQIFAEDKTEIVAQRSLVSRCARAATEKVMEYGGAEKGDRTMVRISSTSPSYQQLHIRFVKVLS